MVYSAQIVLVGAGRGDLQNAVDASVPGQVLELPLGAVYGPLVLPGRKLGIVIQAKNSPVDLAGIRRLPVQYNAPRVESDSYRRPLETRFKTSDVVIRGVRFVSTRPAGITDPNPLIEFGRGDNYAAPQTADDLPRNILLDRCDIFAANETASVGVIANCENLALIGCRVLNIIWGRKDTQGIIATISRGPLIIRDCEIQAAGECVIMGGDPCILPGLRNMEFGLEVSYCEISKPMEWKDRPDVYVKNLFELKHCWKADIHHNLFSNNWFSAQSGEAIVFTPREENPSRYSVSGDAVTKPITRSVPAQHVFLGDIYFHHNVITDVDGGFRISSDDDISISTDIAILRYCAANPDQLSDFEKAEYERIKSQGCRGVLGIGRLVIKDNIVRNVGLFGGSGRMFQIAGSNPAKVIRQLTVQDNTLLHSAKDGAKRNSLVFLEGKPAAIGDFQFLRNTYTQGNYGVFATGGKRGEDTRPWYLDATWKDNVCLDGVVDADTMPNGSK